MDASDAGRVGSTSSLSVGEDCRSFGGAADIHAWVQATSTVVTTGDILTRWAARTPLAPDCQPPAHTWWHTVLNPTTSYWTACRDHQVTTNASTTAKVSCLLAGARRALIAGTVTPATARARLIQVLDHPDTTVQDRWALTAAGPDLYTPGMDAIHQATPAATDVTLRGVAPDGSTITHPGTTITTIDPMRRPAVARLRTSRALAGCLPSEPLEGIFDSEPGTPTPRRRTR